jgi:hypothetical protein
MSNEGLGFLDRFGLSRILGRWARAMQAPGLMSARDLSTLHGELRRTRDRIDTLALRAEGELRRRAGGVTAFSAPTNATGPNARCPGAKGSPRAVISAPAHPMPSVAA